MHSYFLKKLLKETLHFSGCRLFLKKCNNESAECSNIVLPHLFLTPPIEVYPARNVRKKFVTTKFWQIFKLSQVATELSSHKMYSKMLRQFSKESLISIPSESSKIHLLIKVLHRHVWFNLCRWYFSCYALNFSLLLEAVQLYYVLVLRSLHMNYYSFVNVSIPV